MRPRVGRNYLKRDGENVFRFGAELCQVILQVEIAVRAQSLVTNWLCEL